MAISYRGTSLLNILLLLNRCSLGLFFLLAGVDKVWSGVGVFYRGSFLRLCPPWLPDWFALPYGHALPFIEVLLGAALVVGFFGRAVPGLVALVLVSFTIALYQAGLFIPKTGGPFHTNVILLTLALLLAVTGPGVFSVDAVRGRGGSSSR